MVPVRLPLNQTWTESGNMRPAWLILTFTGWPAVISSRLAGEIREISTVASSAAGIVVGPGAELFSGAVLLPHEIIANSGRITAPRTNRDI
jgi:hypothetical protein